MFKRLLQTICIGLILTGLLSTPAAAQSVNLKYIFGAGVSLGWLKQASELGMFPGNYSAYASNAALSYNAAFSPPRTVSPPRPTTSGAMHLIGGLKGQLATHGGGREWRSARLVFQAGVNLATTHIFAQYGKCPNCLASGMQRAGIDIAGIGQSLGLPALVSLGINLRQTGRTMKTRGMTIAQVQAYTGMLASAITTTQEAL